MNCPLETDRSEMLIALAAGELDASTTTALERHLEACEACAALAAEQRAVWDLMDVWEAPPVSPDFDQRLYRRIRQGEPASWWQRLLNLIAPMPLRHAVPLAAAACLLLVAGLIVQDPRVAAPAAPTAAAVQVDQVENTLSDIELLHQFSAAKQAEPAQSDTM